MINIMLAYCAAALILITVSLSGACNSNDDCIQNSSCVASVYENSPEGPGLCVCNVGFKGINGRCVEAAASKQENDNTKEQDAPLFIKERLFPEISDGDDELSRGSNPCPGIKNGDTCFNDGECFQSSDENGIVETCCLCPADYFGLSCQNKKPWDIAPHQTMSDVETRNARFVNQGEKDASTVGRHRAENIDECLTLCETTGNSCHAFNYKTSNDGHNICELLAPRVLHAHPLLPTWIIPADDWTFACCVN